MKVKVLFFASFREIVGSSSLELTIDDGSTTVKLFSALCEMHPQLSLGADQVSIAVNKAYISGLGISLHNNRILSHVLTQPRIHSLITHILLHTVYI